MQTLFKREKRYGNKRSLPIGYDMGTTLLRLHWNGSRTDTNGSAFLSYSKRYGPVPGKEPINEYPSKRKPVIFCLDPLGMDQLGSAPGLKGSESNNGLPSRTRTTDATPLMITLPSLALFTASIAF